MHSTVCITPSKIEAISCCFILIIMNCFCKKLKLDKLKLKVNEKTYIEASFY